MSCIEEGTDQESGLVNLPTSDAIGLAITIIASVALNQSCRYNWETESAVEVLAILTIEYSFLGICTEYLHQSWSRGE